MEDQNPVIKQVEKAIDKAYDENIVTDSDSEDIGRVHDIGYAERLAYDENSIREMNLQSKDVKKYAENITDENIISDKKKIATDTISRNEEGNYPDAQEYLAQKGFSPVERSFSRDKLIRINDIRERKEKIRKEEAEKNQ